jgi:hypothetical protein
VNVDTKERSNSGWTHIHQTSRKRLNKRCLPAGKLMTAILLTGNKWFHWAGHWERKAWIAIWCRDPPWKCVSAYSCSHSSTAGSCLTTLFSFDLAPSDYHLFTYPKNWLRSHSFNNNGLMEGVKTCLSSGSWFLWQAAYKWREGCRPFTPQKHYFSASGTRFC